MRNINFTQTRNYLIPNTKTLIILLCIVLSSCTSKQEKLEQLIQSYEQEGKDIIVKSDSTYFFIYEYKDAFWFKNLDEPDKELFGKGTSINEVFFNLYFSDDGKPYIDTTTYEIKMSPDFWDKSKEIEGVTVAYNKKDFKLLNDDALIFKYKRVFENPSPEIIESTCVYYFSNPNTLFVSNFKFEEMDKYITKYGRKEIARSYAGNLSFSIGAEDIFPYSFGYNIIKGGFFEWIFYTNEKGEITEKNEYISYKNDTYTTPIARTFFIPFFSSKEKARNALSEIMNEIDEQEKQHILKEAITLEDLHKAYKNEIQFERNYLGKNLYFDCHVEYIKEVTGLFEPDYRYKIVSNSVTILGQWWSDYDLRGYTNDENFVELSYPCRVIMKAKLYFGDGKEFKFKDCQLLYFSEDKEQSEN